jgi:hypothetical protein
MEPAQWGHKQVPLYHSIVADNTVYSSFIGVCMVIVISYASAFEHPLSYPSAAATTSLRLWDQSHSVARNQAGQHAYWK